jgi:hypothetical protein
MVGAPVAPGLDVPMEGNIIWSFVYPWPFYTTNTKALDDATYNDQGRWRALNNRWYVSGRPTATSTRSTARPTRSGISGYLSVVRRVVAMIPYGVSSPASRFPCCRRRDTTSRPRCRGPLSHRALPLQPARRGLPADRAVRALPGSARRGDALGDTATVIAGYETIPWRGSTSSPTSGRVVRLGDEGRPCRHSGRRSTTRWWAETGGNAPSVAAISTDGCGTTWARAKR